MSNQMNSEVLWNTDKKLAKKARKERRGLGFKAFSTLTTLYAGLKSKNMPRSNKLIIIGALGYLILPTDLVADFLPLVGLSDDALVITMALFKVYRSMTDEIKEEGRMLAAKLLKK